MGSHSIAVVGAGLIGQKHVDLVDEHAVLSAIVDPSPTAQDLAKSKGVPWFAELEAYLETSRASGVIIATPNHLHVSQGMACVSARIPMLIEKPIADRSNEAVALVEYAKANSVPILVGHHRRYNPLIAAAKAVISEGGLGDLVSVTSQFWLYKPDDYFEMDWRTKDGAGPVYINLIHDIDLLRHFCGEVTTVQAMESRKTRGFDVEDSTAILLGFENGALGTVSVSDTIVAPWSWEMTSAENPVYPNVPTSCYTLGGTKGSLSVPDLTLWQHPQKRSWWEPIEPTQISFIPSEPLVRQLAHFCNVIDGNEEPMVSGEEGLKTLKVIEAIKKAASTGQQVNLT